MDDDEPESPMSPCLWRKRPARSMPKNKFTPEDDERLKDIVNLYGNNWELVSKKMGNKNVRQCKERWENYLSPSINRGPWTEEEDKKLIEKQKEIGSKWVKIAMSFPGRTDASVKNRWQMLDRKQRKQNNLFIRKKKTVKPVQQTKAEVEEKSYEHDDFTTETLDSLDFCDPDDLRIMDFAQFGKEFTFHQEFII